MINLVCLLHRFSLILFLNFILFQSAFPADIKSIGVPYVENYNKQFYQAGNQNWSIVKDVSGVMYYGNSEGLLSFDGKYWRLNQMPNKVIVRSVATDNKGKIYTGGYGEIGYWSYNHEGRFVYHSIKHLIPAKNPLNSDVWKMYVDNNRLIFQSFDCIYIYEKGKITAIDVTEPFLFLLKANNRFFIEILSKGMYELKGSKLQFIPGSEILANTEVLSVLPFNNNYLMGTAKDGLFIYNGSTIKPWKINADNFLKTYQLNNGSVVFNKYMAYGTILNGLIIIDAQGNIVQHINKLSGLQNNTVLSLYTDDDQNLWTGLDNGIDRVELNSPLYYYFDKTGQFGTIYASIIDQNKIYIGTNQGLFYSDWSGDSKSFQPFNFKFVPNSQGQIWDLSLIDGQLISGTNEGTFVINNTSLQKISSVNGGWVIKKLTSNPDYLIQGTYLGLVLYQKDAAGKWKFSHSISGFEEPARYVEQDPKGQFWVTHAYKGVYRINVSADLKKVTSIKYYDAGKGLPGNNNVNIFFIEGRIVFSSDKGFYLYDDLNDTFKPYTELNKLLGGFAFSNKVIPVEGKRYWFINHGKVAMVNFISPGKAEIDSNRFSTLTGHMVQYYENINRINKSMYLISVDDGFVFYNDEDLSRAIKLPHVLIRKVESADNKITTLTENNSAVLTLPYSKNSIRFSYSLPYYQKSLIEYQYFLEGYSSQWSEWSTQSQKDFTNLSYGSYEFIVRARVNGNQPTETTVLKFRISPPWYASVWAWIVYTIAFVLLIMLMRKIYFRKLAKEKLFIQQKLQKEQEEYLKQEAIANERMIAQFQKEQLEADLESKNREMANTAMNIVYKNELLDKIKEELYNLTDSQGKKLSGGQLKKIQKVIDEGVSENKDWTVFENSFNEAHGNFFKKLKTDYSGLVPNDIKLCAYLRMNMSSKEIASLLNITVRGVEIRRYRLRKKLNLPTDKNLTEFLLEL